MRNKRAIPGDDIAPSDDVASSDGDELRVALRYIVHHKFTGLCQSGSFEERKVLSLTGHVVKSAVEALHVFGRNSSDRHAGEKLTYRFTSEENELKLHRYWTNGCRNCFLKSRCTPSPQRRIKRWEHEDVLEGRRSGSTKIRALCARSVRPPSTRSAP
jgi:hypothetical protein